ncbi:MAG: hypothetical protein U5L45_20855, partial [Saprospiraceae bacterium]|nr:hypothetical protein [Saprospiraceae bacterium]
PLKAAILSDWLGKLIENDKISVNSIISDFGKEAIMKELIKMDNAKLAYVLEATSFLRCLTQISQK